MTEISSSLRCPGCKGDRFSVGKLIESSDFVTSIQFKPDANWVCQHPIFAATCLECGIVTLVVNEKSLGELRRSRPE
jgi:hypothetical protein